MVKMEDFTFSSESVTEGHPDKVCDKISDSILDACLEKDPESRFACETLVKGYMPDEKTVKYAVVLAGEITTKANLETNFLDDVVVKTLKEIGYDNPESGFDANDCQIIKLMTKQSADIAQGVNKGEGDFKEQGAGDQGMMFGFASNETPELMPLAIVLAHKLTSRLTFVRKSKQLPYLRPDGKSQVAVKYVGGKPVALENVIIATQHDADISMRQLRADIKEFVINPICKDYMSSDTKFFINATGKFVIGGPLADAGVTGRKIIVDTYGGMGKHGGGAFSGKDPSKVDRSGAYAARYIAKNLVAAGLVDMCEVQLAYVIGKAEPTSILIDDFGTGKLSNEELSEIVRKEFPIKPAKIIKHFDLKRPIYADTAAYGHFGRNEFPWEDISMAKRLKNKYLK